MKNDDNQVIVKSINVHFPQYNDACFTLYVGPAKEATKTVTLDYPELATDMAELSAFAEGAALFYRGSRTIIVWVPNVIPAEPRSIGTLVHELLHAVLFLHQRNGIGFEVLDGPQELLAYDLEYALTKVLNAFHTQQTWYERRFVGNDLVSFGNHFKTKAEGVRARKKKSIPTKRNLKK